MIKLEDISLEGDLLYTESVEQARLDAPNQLNSG